jgi:hypothetical protein
VAFGADEVRFDVRAQALEAVGHVRVEEPPFHLTSESLRLRRVPIGVELDGEGRLAFCPCLGAPLSVRFRNATIAPPHDLVLREPVLEVFGVPVAWAPAFWLRDAGRAGVLPPIVEWRGADGLRLGGGVHVPWFDGDTQRGVDLRGAAYVQGGALADVAMRTAATETRVVWDDLRGQQGVGIAARGAPAAADVGVAAVPVRAAADIGVAAVPVRAAADVAWIVDALRGARAVQAVTDLDAAARPYDRFSAQAAWRSGGWTFSSGVRAMAPRGGDLGDFGAGGPIASVHRADGLGGIGAYDATIEGGAARTSQAATTTFVRAEGGGLLAARPGIAGTTLAVRGLGDVADDGTQRTMDAAGQLRARAAIPLLRGFGSEDAEDPWVHRTEPRVELAALGAQSATALSSPATANGAVASVLPGGRGTNALAGAAWVAAAGWANQVGRFGSRASWDADASGGAVGDGRRALPAVLARAAATGQWLVLRADFARVFASGSGEKDGGALIARGRVGLASSVHLALHVAERDGVDPIVARALVDTALEPASGYLSAAGWSGGARAALPLGPRLTVRGGADVDIGVAAPPAAAPSTPGLRLVAATGALEFHDPCGCLVLRITAAHRVGRDGVDLWVTVDLPPR